MFRIYGPNGSVDAESAIQSSPTIIAAGGIKIERENELRASSLYYANFEHPEQFRWYEICFQVVEEGLIPILTSMKSDVRPGVLIALPPEDFGMVTFGKEKAPFDQYSVAGGPTPIDDEDVERFINRWMTLFAVAADGDLKHLEKFPFSL